MADRRFFLGAATTRWPRHAGLEDRPELAAELDRMAVLFESKLGYQVVPGLGVDISSSRLKDTLGQFLTDSARTADDVVVFYYTGHAEPGRDDFALPFPETNSADLVRTAVWISELERWMLDGTVVQNVLVILDTCYAADARLFSSVKLRTAAGSLTSYAFLAASRPAQEALSGAFTHAFARVVDHPASGGDQQRYLSIEDVVRLVQEQTPTWQTAEFRSAGTGVLPFLPNPRYEPRPHALDLRSQRDEAAKALRASETTAHVLPRAQGIDTNRDDLWLFTGRDAALHFASSWLAGAGASHSTLVVSGDPGSGKSALLARLYVLAEPKLRRAVPRLDLLAEDTLPPNRSIDRFIHASGRTHRELLDGLCEAADVDAATAGGLVQALAHRASPVTVVIDALDEATDPDAVLRELRILVRGAENSALRLLIGTRDNLVDQLPGAVDHLDLDSEEFVDPKSIRTYAERCLLDWVDDSPYRDSPEVAAAVADAVAVAADKSFLVAQITARSLALRPDVVDPSDDGWRGRLPTLAADAMRMDLDERLGAHADKARDLLCPLAYAEGAGLPWADVWRPLAVALSGKPYTQTDLDWLVRVAGFYVLQALDETGRSVYRLYHEALAEHIRTRVDTWSIRRRFRAISPRAPADRAHLRIARQLVADVPMGLAGKPDWTQAHPYSRTHLATHASKGGQLDELLVDPEYLLIAESTRLLSALPGARSNDGRAAAAAYRAASFHIRTADTGGATAYLELTAHQYGADRLAERIRQGDRQQPWTVRWARWKPASPHRLIGRHPQPVRAVAAATLDGRRIAVSGGEDATVRVWDLVAATALGEPMTGHSDTVTAVATTVLDSGPAVVSGSDDTTVRVWDLTTATALGTPMRGHQDAVTAIAVATLDGCPVAISGSADTTVRVWDLVSRTALGDPMTGHTVAVTAVAVTTFNGRPVCVSSSGDYSPRGRAVLVWDLATRERISEVDDWDAPIVDAMVATTLDKVPTMVTTWAEHTDKLGLVRLSTMTELRSISTGHQYSRRSDIGISAIAVADVAGRAVVITGGADSTVRICDLSRGQPAGPPLVGHASRVTAIAVADVEGQPHAVSAGEDGAIRIWDLAHGINDEPPVPAEPHSSVLKETELLAVDAAVVDEQPVAVTVWSNPAIVQMWELSSGGWVGDAMQVDTHWVDAVAVATVEGRPVAVTAGPSGGWTYVWDLSTCAELDGVAATRADHVTALCVAQVNGRFVVVVGHLNGWIGLWDPVSGTFDGLGGHGGDMCTAASVVDVDGRPVAVTVGGSRRYSDVDTVRVWDLTTFAEYDSLPGHTDTVTAVVTTAVGGSPVAMTAGQDGRIMLWDLAAVRPRRRRWPILRRRPKPYRKVDTHAELLAYHPDFGLVGARSSHIDFQPLDPEQGEIIDVDAAIHSMAFGSTHELVVGTGRGVVVLGLLSPGSAVPPPPRRTPWPQLRGLLTLLLIVATAVAVGVLLVGVFGRSILIAVIWSPLVLYWLLRTYNRRIR